MSKAIRDFNPLPLLLLTHSICVSFPIPVIRFLNPPMSLENLVLDMSMFNFIPVSFCFFVNFRVRVRLGLGSVIGLGLGLEFGIGNLKHI